MIHFNISKILIPVDFSDTSLLAIKHGAYIGKSTGASVYILHVINAHYVSQDIFLPVVNIQDQGKIQDVAQTKLDQIAADVKAEFGIDVQQIIKVGPPSNEISKVAKEIHASLIVMGTHGYSPVEELVIGSTALKVITKSPCPTMAMSGAATHNGYKKILIPIDTSGNSRQKVNYTLELAKKFGSAVHAIALLTSSEDSEIPAMELILHQIDKLAKEKGVAYDSEIVSHVKNRATATVQQMEKSGADLVIIMTDQDAELSGFFLGPYSQQVIHLSKVPVIAIKPEDLFVNDSSILSGTSGGGGY
jgi:nucleotide-binding universal stress UspA family protein